MATEQQKKIARYMATSNPALGGVERQDGLNPLSLMATKAKPVCSKGELPPTQENSKGTTEGGNYKEVIRMPDIQVEIEVFCAKCGAGLCNNTTSRQGKTRYGNEAFYVEPCEKCIDDALDKGYSKGYERASARKGT